MRDGARDRPQPSFRVYIRERDRPQTGSLRFTVTEADGRFAFENLRLGVFDIFIAHSGQPTLLSRSVMTVRRIEQRPLRRYRNPPHQARRPGPLATWPLG